MTNDFPVEAGHILMFARAIGDTNPLYTDSEAAARSEAGGVVAPPTFTQASSQFDPEYMHRPKPGHAWVGSGREPTGIPRAEKASGGGSLHAEQHFEFHQPVLAGDVLSIEKEEGAAWEKEGRRGGRLLFREFITRFRNQHGELVVTARGIGVQTERPADAS